MDAETIYDVPLLMRKEKLDVRVLSRMKVSSRQEPDLDDWKTFLGKLKNPVEEVNIGLIGKYVSEIKQRIFFITSSEKFSFKQMNKW